MKENKNIQEKELNSVNGGTVPPIDSNIRCKNCEKTYFDKTSEKRTVGSGCDKHTEYKCPNCGTWNY